MSCLGSAIVVGSPQLLPPSTERWYKAGIAAFDDVRPAEKRAWSLCAHGETLAEPLVYTLQIRSIPPS